jgi:E3 SUMO-protein ligase PIAS1
MRISLPCRSISCRHNACFDATSYLQLQEQGPTWLCPVCNNSAPFDSLAVDEYVKDILSNTSSELEQVTIEPNGTWSRGRKSESPSKKGASFPSDDEDLVEIKDSKPVLGTDSTKIASALPGSMHPPQAPSRDSPASGSQTYPSISTKRPISEVIDLTSDDEEDPRPPPKRQFIGHSTPQTPHTAPTARMLPGSQ